MVAEIIAQDEIERSAILCPVPAVGAPLSEPPTVWIWRKFLQLATCPSARSTPVSTVQHLAVRKGEYTPTTAKIRRQAEVCACFMPALLGKCHHNTVPLQQSETEAGWNSVGAHLLGGVEGRWCC